MVDATSLTLVVALGHMVDATSLTLVVALAHMVDATSLTLVVALAHMVDATSLTLVVALAHMVDAHMVAKRSDGSHGQSPRSTTSRLKDEKLKVCFLQSKYYLKCQSVECSIIQIQILITTEIFDRNLTPLNSWFVYIQS